MGVFFVFDGSPSTPTPETRHLRCVLGVRWRPRAGSPPFAPPTQKTRCFVAFFVLAGFPRSHRKTLPICKLIDQGYIQAYLKDKWYIGSGYAREEVSSQGCGQIYIYIY